MAKKKKQYMYAYDRSGPNSWGKAKKKPVSLT